MLFQRAFPAAVNQVLDMVAFLAPTPMQIISIHQKIIGMIQMISDGILLFMLLSTKANTRLLCKFIVTFFFVPTFVFFLFLSAVIYLFAMASTYMDISLGIFDADTFSAESAHHPEF